MNCDLVFSGMALHKGLDGDALLRDSELLERVVISDFFFSFFDNTLSHPVLHPTVYYGSGVWKLLWAEYCLGCQNKHAYFND